MKRLTLIYLFAIYSCSHPCDELDCITDEKIRLEIESLNAASFLDENRYIYRDSLEINFMHKGNQEAADFEITGSRVLIYPNYDVNEYFVNLSGKTDTLHFQFKVTSTRCCGDVIEIDEVIVNGVKMDEHISYIVLER